MEWNLRETFETGAGSIRWDRLGTGGDPVVLVHGTPYSSFLWRDIAPALADDREVYVFDLLGYGQSEQRDGQDLSIAAQARRLVDLLGHWRLERPAVVANDVGGAVVLHALLLDGARYRNLTLFDAVTGGDWEHGLFDLIRRHADVFAQLPEYAHREVVAAHLRRATHTGYRPAVLDRHLQPWLGADGQAGFYRQYRQLAAADTRRYEDRLADIDIPVTLLWGRHDEILPPPFAEWIRERLPHADFGWIDDAGHLLSEDAPAQLLARLRVATARP